MTIVEGTHVITGGVDTHAGMHVAAAQTRPEAWVSSSPLVLCRNWVIWVGPRRLAGAEVTGHRR